jgi:hypothetical protein
MLFYGLLRVGAEEKKPTKAAGFDPSETVRLKGYG